MAMVQLAYQEDKSLPLSIIAEADGLSVTFLEQLFAKLKKASLVISHRGVQGGYLLAKRAKDITILDVIHAVDQPQKAVRCITTLGCTPKGARCSTHHLWEALDDLKDNFLGTTTLFDVIHNKTSFRMKEIA